MYDLYTVLYKKPFINLQLLRTLFSPVFIDPVLSVSTAVCWDFNIDEFNLAEKSSPAIPSLSLDETKRYASKLTATDLVLQLRVWLSRAQMRCPNKQIN